MVEAGRQGIRKGLLGGVLCALLMAAGCASRNTQPASQMGIAPGGPIRSTVGTASWYGPGFDGKHTASGEVYDQNQMTAASIIFPLGSDVLVTDLSNGRAVQVRINDHGPYVKGRAIDLSHGAARMLGMIGPGTARVRMDMIETPLEDRSGETGYFVQVGSYTAPANAERAWARLTSYYSDARIDRLDNRGRRYYRVRMGVFPSRIEAHARAVHAAQLGFPVMIVSE